MSTTHNGSVSEDVLYYPWGQFWTSAGTLYEHHFATFAVEDTTTGVDPTLFRDYKTTHGRWLSPDPAGLGAVDLANPQSLNRYAYVMNNPLSFVDPLGLCPSCKNKKTGVTGARANDGGFDPTGGQGDFSLFGLNPVLSGFEGTIVGYVPGTDLRIIDWQPTYTVVGFELAGAFGAANGWASSGVSGVAANNGQPQQTRRQCVSNFLQNNYGNLVGRKVVPDFSLISIGTNFWGYAKSSALTLAVKGAAIFTPKALSWAATTTGSNLAAYPGMATASADALESGAFWGTTAATAEWVIAPLAVGATAFSTTADAYARWSCRNVQ